MTVPPGLHEEMRRLAEAGDVTGLLRYARQVHASDLSDVLAQLDAEVQLRLVQALPPALISEALAEMEHEEHPEALLAQLRPEQAADIVEELDDDDAVDLIAELPPATAQRVLAAVADRADLERLLAYDEETAGGRMTTALVSVPADLTIGEALAAVRAQAEEVDDLFQVYCVEADGRLTGVLPLQKLVIARPDRPVRDVMEAPDAAVSPETDQEEVARVMARYNVAAVPVVDALGRLLGRVTFDDVIDVVEAETTEDLLKFGGVPGPEDLAAPWTTAVRSRLPWLYVNLLTAFLAASVVFLFQETISRVIALAVWMPIIAGMGGNAGTQTLAVTVRRIALGLIPADRAFTVVRKELTVGLINGLATGVVVGAVAALMGPSWLLGVVVTLAMWGNVIIAGIAGSLVPIVLGRIGADPAVASSIFVTTFTDVFGFLFLLGLGTWVLVG